MSGKKRRYDKFGENSETESSSSDDEFENTKKCRSETIGPVLPPSAKPIRPVISNCPIQVGPSLPPDWGAQQAVVEGNEPIGPALPSEVSIGPKLPNKNNFECESCSVDIGPALPPHLVRTRLGDSIKEIGPVLPTHVAGPSNENREQSDEQKANGPCLPPNFLNKSSNDVSLDSPVIGPALPQHLQNSIGPAMPPNLLNEESFRSGEARILGPTLPPGFRPPEDSDSDEESFGPDPRLMHTGDVNFDAVVAERAEKARRKMLGLDDKKIERESWMLELPPEKGANLGLGARQFRAKLAPVMGDRSVWTDTPSDTAKKAGLPPKQDDKALIKQQAIAERDREMEKMAQKAEKKARREESLLNMHATKLKKEAKEDTNKRGDEPPERKRFNREEDMQVHRFDDAQKKAIFKKAQMLNDRFSRGESKFL